MADILAIYKKDPLNKKNYRSVGLLSHMSHLLILLEKTVETFMSNNLWTKLSGFHKNLNTQYCLIYVLEKWNTTLSKGKYVGAVFMVSQKPLINYNLLIAKLEAYGFSNNSLLIISLSYLKIGSQRVSINSSFSTLEEIVAGVPQGSTLWPLLNDIFYFENNVLYAFGSNLAEVN